MMPKRQKTADAKEQLNVGFSPWVISVIKALARETNQPASEVARQALMTGLVSMLGGDVRNGTALIQKWESSTQNDEPDDKSKPE